MIRCAIYSLAIFATPVFAGDWPHWRGPDRSGLVAESSGWADGKWLADKPMWTAKVGEGASSPLVVGERVYLLGWAGGQDHLRCLNLADGQELWAVKYRCPQYGRHHMGDEGLYSGPSGTPEFDASTNRLFTLSTNGDLQCWDAKDGKRVWGRNLYDDYKVARRPKLTRAPQRDYGYTSSPMVHGDWLLVEVGSAKGTLIAFDKRTGKEVWASTLKDEAGHTGGPAPMTVEGIACVVVLTQRNLAAIRLDKGHEGETLATFPWVTDFANSIAGPAVQGNHALVTSAYNHNAICKVRFTKTEATEVWRQKFPSKVCTPVIHKGSVYVAWQQVRCLDWETGELKWEGGRFSDPGSCVVTSDDRLVVYGGNGTLALVETAGRSPKAYQELAVRQTPFKALAWPHVVVANGRVICRDREGNVACYGR